MAATVEVRDFEDQTNLLMTSTELNMYATLPVPFHFGVTSGGNVTWYQCLRRFVRVKPSTSEEFLVLLVSLLPIQQGP